MRTTVLGLILTAVFAPAALLAQPLLDGGAVLTATAPGKAVAERVLQARAAYGITRAGQWPTIDASADIIAARSSQVGANRGIPAGTDTDVSYAQAGFSLNWELDVWGRLRRLNEAARAQYGPSRDASGRGAESATREGSMAAVRRPPRFPAARARAPGSIDDWRRT